MREAVQQFKGATLAGWVALVLTVFAAVANFFKLVLNSTYAYGYPDFDTMLVDPVTGFAFGVMVIMLCAYLVRGLLRRDVWPALISATMMPFLYLLMLNGIAVALTHQQNYFALHGDLVLYAQVVPSCLMVIVFGAEALINYRYKFRRFT